MKKGTKKRTDSILFWIKLLAGVYAGAAITLYFIQHKLLFHPQALPSDHQFKFKHDFEEITLRPDTQTSIHLVRFSPAKSIEKKGAVIYFHGNSENINRYAVYADNFLKHGYEVWMMDFPGFGKSTGKMDIDLLNYTAGMIYDKVTEIGYSADDIVIYGKSLGTGFASKLASQKPCKRLILETPYYSLDYAASQYLWMFPVKYMMKYNITSHRYIRKVMAPITIFHGTNDGVVFYKNSQLLAQHFKKQDELITIEGGTHNDLNSFPLMQRKLDELLSN